jgi:hypothetical protein
MFPTNPLSENKNEFENITAFSTHEWLDLSHEFRAEENLTINAFVKWTC